MSSNFTIDNFCGSQFWNSSITWNTDSPDFTPCFQRTVLVWTPCLYLWVAALLDTYYILNSKESNIPWNILNISKLVFTCLLIVLKLVDLGVAVHFSTKSVVPVFNVDFYSPCIMILTFGLAATLLYLNRKYGLRTSGVLFFFWFIFLLTGIPQFRSEITDYLGSTRESLQYSFISYMVFYPVIFIMFLLNCFADSPPNESQYKYHKMQCPGIAAGFPSRLTFSWFDPLALTGFRRSLTESDIWTLNPQDTSAEVVPKFDKFWGRTLQKQTSDQNATYNKNATSVEFKSNKKKKPASVLPALCLAFGGPFLFGEVLKFLCDILMFVSPQILKLLIGFVQSDEPIWKGYLYAVTLFVCATIQTILLEQYFTRMYVVGMRIRTALTSAIYRKALRMCNAAKKESTTGEIINLMSVDAHRFLELTAFLNMIWSAPLQIALAMYFLWDVLGPSVLAGLAGMIILLPFSGVLASFQKSLELKQMKYKDERVKLMNEILNGIKVLKIYAWEPSFEQQVLAIRDKELRILKQTAYLDSAKTFIWTCTPFMVSLMSFACFVLVNDTEVLDSQRAFVALSLFNILRFPLSMLPNVISHVVQAAVGIKRINKFMNCDDLDPSSIEHSQEEPNPIVIEKGYFSWDGNESEPVLKNINLNIPRGSLVAVVGAVGSGKSSLLSALLGEMNKLSGRVNTTGSIAYVPQQAWIQNATLQDNILFGQPLDKHKYNDVIGVCALKTDFEVLPGGDQTEIGEKGINLSGGQKQRVSLARAVYCAADNYFLDDPLSAVDSHVGKHIFEKVIGPGGLLQHTTRVWVTHNVSYLAQTDLVVVLRDGEVSEAGSYQQLLEKKGAFAEFLLHHLSDAKRTSPEELEEIKNDIESKLGQEFQKKLQRARSKSETASENEQISAGDQVPQTKTTKELKEENKIIEVEKAETGNVKWEVYKHYLRSIGMKSTILTMFMFLIVRLFLVGSDFWLAKWSTDNNMIVNGTVDTKLRDLYLGVYGGLGIGQATTSFFADLMLFLSCLRAGKIVHELLLDNVMKAPLQFFEVTPAGRIISRFSRDVDILDSSLTWQVSSMIGCIFELLGSIFVISFSTPIFMAVVLPIGLLYFLIQRYFVATSRQLMRLESISCSPIYSHFGESIGGASTIRAYGVTQRFIEESEKYVDRNQSIYYSSSIADRWLGVRLETVGSLIIFFAALFAVLARDTISPGLVGLSITYSLEVTMTLNWLVRMISEVETNIVAVERIREYTDIPQEAAWNIGSGPGASWPETGAVQLESVTLAYRASSGAGEVAGVGVGEPALRDVTCAVAPRDKVGIVGRTGAGKSTLTLGLFRIVEAARGRILIDGVDIATLGLHQLRSRITIIPQDPVLFSGTLRLNLDPFGVHSDDDIWRSLEHAHLKAFVQALPAGLRHEIAEGGENLSVGQRQLVCLARALLRKTPLLVLDEATAAVDLETDDLIQKTIRSEFAACTVLTIAHRLNTIMDSTKVMVLDKGQLVEYAPPEQLLQDKNSIFYSMAKDAGLI